MLSSTTVIFFAVVCICSVACADLSSFESFESRFKRHASASRKSSSLSPKGRGSSPDQYGRTFGQYGSYRRHFSWRNAVVKDKVRQATLTDRYPWLFQKTPTLSGFGMKGFWNSYADAPALLPEIDRSQMERLKKMFQSRKG